ncbi:Crp/Fnr family transcriptional regulator [uncultured Ilyobacter sp.]|uniref:Crp/Fnr family transcriptional regulator n=1 Tax=uncultured Ilyobacter sp. TaxID=544433 RepID=UPI002AA6EE70|nr:Crp/Fnr family transcriptional regulator [uncultured Ilyobacter sp.]
MNKIYNKLMQTTLFNGIPLDEIEKKLSARKYKIKKYKKGETVAFRGDEIDGLYINIKGELNPEMMKHSGETRKIGNLDEGQIIASAFIFGKKFEFPVDLLVEKDCEIFYISKEELMELMIDDKKILKNFLDEISNKAQFLSTKVWNAFNNKSINEKLINYILKNEKNGEFLFKPSLKDVANLFGVARPSLSRVIGEFVDEGILERTGRSKYRVLDIDMLEEKREF